MDVLRESATTFRQIPQPVTPPRQPKRQIQTMIEPPVHTLEELFEQLGLPSDEASRRAFIEAHAPLPNEIPLPDAPFWTPAQATFLREELVEDADWAEVIEELNTLLRKNYHPKSGS